MDTGFQKLQVKVQELWKQVLKREKRKYVDCTKSRITGFASWSCLRLHSMALTQQKLFVRRSLVSGRMEILAFSFKLLLPFPVLSNMFSILIGLCKFFHTRNMEK